MRTWLAAAVLCLAAAHSISAQDWDRERWRRRDGVQIRVARNYHLPADQIASWPVVVIGGSATIDGRMDDDLVVVGGPVRVGPGAQIRGNIVALGGEVRIADTARINGEIHDVAVVWPRIEFALRDWLWRPDSGWWATFALAGTLARLTLTMVGACFLALVAPAWIRRIQFRVVDAPIASGLLGVATQVLAVPLLLMLVVGLVVTIVGIPLLALVPFAVAGLAIVWLAGFTAVAAQIGRGLRGAGPIETPVADTAVGVLLLSLASLIGHVLALGPGVVWPLAGAFGAGGFVLEYLAWTVGLGAALLAPMRGWRVSPPPLPSQVATSA